jgi:hypothetical protein
MIKFLKPALLAAAATTLAGTGATAAVNRPAGAVQGFAQFRQTPPAKGAAPKTLYYKNEDLIKTTSTTTKTPIYGTVTTPVYTTVKKPIYDSKGKVTGYTSTKVQTGTTTATTIIGYNSVTTKSTKITPKSQVYTTATGTGTTPGATPVLLSFSTAPYARYRNALAGEQSALFSFAAASTSAPVLTNGLFSQSFGPGTLSFTRTAPILSPVGAALTNLLKVSFDSIDLFAPKSGSQFWLTAKTGTSNISYSSDFFSFTRPGIDTAYEFSLLGSGASPITLASIDPTLTNVTGARSLTTFRGNEVGVLGVSAVPEPAAWAMMLIGFGGLGSTLRRQRRKPRLALAA